MYIGQTKSVANKNRKFGAADEYIATYLQNDDYEPVPYLFTQAQLNDAKKRAEDNKEDMPSLKNSTMNYLFLIAGICLGASVQLFISLFL